MTANSPIPAIANAIYDACGVRLTEMPFTPERVLRGWTSLVIEELGESSPASATSPAKGC